MKVDPPTAGPLVVLWAALSLVSCVSPAPPASPRPRSPAPSPTSAPAGAAAEGSMRSEEVAPGVRYGELRAPFGPSTVHLVTIAPGACGVELHTVKGTDRVVGRERPSEIARRTEQAEGRPVLVAVNADFFSFEPPGVPEGPQVSAGEIVQGEGTHREAVTGYVLREQPVVGVTAAGRVFLADAHLAGWVRAARDSLPLGRVNHPPAGGSAALYNRFVGDSTPPDTGVVEAVVHPVRQTALPGDTALGIVVRVDTASAGVAVPEDGAVFAVRRDPRWTVHVGDSVRWVAAFRGAPAGVRELVGGFPMLLRRGRPVAHEIAGMIPGFADKRHGRTAVALRADGTLLLLAVDGRQADSPGMTLDELTRYLQSLGAVDALNLDGGGSTTLVLRGTVINRPSDRAGERPVANALLVLGPRPAACPGRKG
jgi:hypothetical protein